MKKMKRVLTGALACTMILSGSMLAMATETQNDIAINPNADQTATTGQQKPGAEPISTVSPTLNTVASIPYCEFIRAVVVVVDGEQPQIMDAHYATPYMIKAKELDLIQGRELEKWNTPATYDEMTAVLDKLDESQKNAAIESLNSLLVDTVEVNGTEIDFVDMILTVINGNVMIPLRKTSDALGFELTWDAETNSASIDNGEVKTTVQLGLDSYYRASSKAIGLTQAKPLGTSPRLIDDSTYVPANLFNLLFTSETVSVKDGILHIDTLKKPIIKED